MKLKRKISLIVLLLIIIITLTGCVSIDSQFKINSNGSLEATVITLVNIEDYKNLLQVAGGAELTDDNIKEQIGILIEEEQKLYTDKGYTVENIDDMQNGNIGFKAKKSFNNANEISYETCEAKGLEYITITQEKETFKIREETKALLDFSSTDETELTTGSIEYFDFKFTLEFPYKVQEHNASEVTNNGKTLIWNLDLFGMNEINAVGNKLSTLSVVLLISGALIIILGAIFIIMNFDKKKKKAE